MDKLSTLLQLTSRFDEAARGSDWEALAQADQTLASLLPQLAQESNWSPAERTAFNGLHDAHQRAKERCADELTQLDQRLARMRAGKEGGLAYAQDGEREDFLP